ncbi:MAG TPA: hypothetical protein VFI79_03675 [Gemmatimonadales bacterium]|nr:hypothetical protein [Gemmatimonadales bacterium]
MAPHTDRLTAIGNLQIAVTAFERQLGALEEVPAAGLEEVKTALDDLRLRIWTVLMAQNSENSQEYLDRFRLRRAAENLQLLAFDVEAGRLKVSKKEADELLQALEEIESRLRKVG